MQSEEFGQQFRISIETLERAELYHAMLLRWQRAINLVSNSTLDDAWTRHFADSAQLVRYIPDHVRILADFGSGAGFPGLVLAIMRPEIEVHLTETDERKVQFLRSVSRETSVGCAVHNVRIEDMAAGKLVPDLITARALSSLEQLCGYSVRWAQENPALELLFLKGENAGAEIKEARRNYDFDLDIYESVTSKASSVLHLRGLKQCA